MARILIVDDSAIMRRNLKSILTQAGHTIVAEATNGGQANLLYRTHLPDLVTMDITMPITNGIEAVKLIKRDYPDANIVMVSALNQRHMVFEALKLGAKHYLVKPITPETVISVVNKVLGIEQEQKNQEALETEEKNTGIEEESKEPFTIKNVENTFHINITRHFSEESITALNQASQGLLFVQPLKVSVNFGSIENIPLNLLEKIGEIVDNIIQAKGIVRVISHSNQLVKLIKEKEIKGLNNLIESVN